MAGNKQKTYCIMCGKEKNGIEVKEDNVIRAIRFLKKRVFRSEKRNRIVVCKECYENYKKHRKRYTRRQALYLALGVLFLIMVVFVGHSIYSVLVGMGMVLLLYLFSLLNYVPELNIIKDRKQ